VTPDQLADRIRARCPDTFVARGEVTVQVGRDDLLSTLKFLRDDPVLSMGFLSCVTATDWPGKDPRFWVVYELRSMPHRHRVRVKVGLAEHDPHVPTATTMFPTANWHERETFDMLGVQFSGHPNLERILMWEGFNGHPLRKDFPVRGIDTGARIYPEVFPEGAGPKAGSTGKDYKDVNIWEGEWKRYGMWPLAGARAAAGTQQPFAPELGNVVAATAKPTEEAPWHDPEVALSERMKLAEKGNLKDKLFAAMAQTDCTACGWDCEGYGNALATGETKDVFTRRYLPWVWTGLVVLLMSGLILIVGEPGRSAAPRRRPVGRSAPRRGP